MSKWIKPLEIANALVLILLGISIFTALNNVRYSAFVDAETKDYHIAIVTDEIKSSAYESFIAGINHYSNSDEIALEIYNSEALSTDDIFDMLLMTKVDGVIIKLSDNAIANPFMSAFSDQGMKVVVIGNDLPESERDAFVGSNKYQMGKESGYLAGSAASSTGHVSIIFGSDYKDEATVATRSYLSGFRESIASATDISLKSIHFTVDERAETIVGQLLSLEPLPDVIVCTDPLDVSRVIRVLVDRNLVGNVKVVGSGSNADIIEWIEKDVIYASVVESHDTIGELAMTTMHQLLSEEKSSVYVNIPFDILTKYGRKKDLQR